MGACWSNQIDADGPSRTGFDSKSESKDGFGFGSMSSCKVSSSLIPMTSRSEGEILASSNLKGFSFSELKTATRYFQRDSVLGEGGFGSVFKGWIDEQTLTATKPGTGMTIAVKRLKQRGLQGHKEWLKSTIWGNYIILVEWAKPYLTNKRRIFHVLDTRLEGQYSISRAQKAANLALQCLAVEPKCRPTMDEVVATLEQLQDSEGKAKNASSLDRPKSCRSSSTNVGSRPATAYPRPSNSPLFA